MSDSFWTAFPRLHCKVPCFPRTSKPNIRAPSSKRSGSLQIKSSWASSVLTYSDGTICGRTLSHFLFVRQHRPNECFHYLWCHVLPKAQSDETVSFSGKYHRLKWPQRLIDLDLLVGLSQIQQGCIRSMLALLLPQFAGINIGISLVFGSPLQVLLLPCSAAKSPSTW